MHLIPKKLVYPFPWIWTPANGLSFADHLKYRDSSGNHLVYKAVSGVNHLAYCPAVPGEDCSVCNSGTTPAQVALTVPECTQEGGTLPAGTYILNQTIPLFPCDWRYVLAPAPSYSFLHVGVSPLFGGGVRITAYWGYWVGGLQHEWVIEYGGTSIDCSFDNIEIPGWPGDGPVYLSAV